MTPHDPDREYEGIPLPDGDDELTALLNGIDVDRGWQELLHRTRADQLLQQCPGKADPLDEADVVETFNTVTLTPPEGCYGQASLFSCESPLPYGIDALLQDIRCEVQVLQHKATRRRMRSSQGSKAAPLAASLLQQVQRLQQGLAERTMEQETASKILASCLRLVGSITEYNYSEGSSSTGARQLAEHARDVRRLLEHLDRLVARLFDDTDVTDPCVPVRPGP